MTALSATPLLADPSFLDGPALLGESAWTWRQVHTAAIELAGRIDPGATVCNLCASRPGFIVAWLAALRRGCVQLLPPSGGHNDLVSILGSSAQPLIVVDDEALIEPHWPEHARCIVHRPTAPAAGRASLAWQPDWDAASIRLYTSGSTGSPDAQDKTLAQLAHGAVALSARLGSELEGGLGRVQRIVSSVPPQHMFGLETSVMLSLITGIAVQDGQPLLPADIRASLVAGEGMAAWIATPLHLRAVVQAREALPACAFVLVSTMPLAPALAAQAEGRASAPVLEIYGSTETGALAMRRAAADGAWLPFANVRVEPGEHGTRVWGDHFTSPRVLLDDVSLDADGGFRIAGRHSDVIKIGGRRASLAGLNLLLQDLPGLEDGVFYLPATDSPTQRLVLIYSGAALDRAAALRWLRARMDPVFLPRTMIRVDRMPRTAASKLPRSALDRIHADWQSRGSAR